MASSADILALGTHAGRFFFRKRSKASSRLPTSPALTSARATCGRPGDLQLASAKTDSTLQRHVQAVEPRDHFVNAILPDGLKLGDVRQQLLVLRVQAIAEQMNFRVVVLGGEFGAGDEINACRPARRGHARTTLDRIMVRQGQRREAEPVTVADQFLRRERPVGEIRVQM